MRNKLHPPSCVPPVKTPPLIEEQSARHLFYNDEVAMGRDSVPVAIECKASGE